MRYLLTSAFLSDRQFGCPLARRVLQGIVLELTAVPAVEDTRDISGVIESAPLLSAPRIALARWISHHYLAPLLKPWL